MPIAQPLGFLSVAKKDTVLAQSVRQAMVVPEYTVAVGLWPFVWPMTYSMNGPCHDL